MLASSGYFIYLGLLKSQRAHFIHSFIHSFSKRLMDSSMPGTVVGVGSSVMNQTPMGPCMFFFF